MATPRTMQKKRYNDEHYDTITFTVPKGAKDAFKSRMSEKDESMNNNLKRYVLAYISTKPNDAMYGCKKCENFHIVKMLIEAENIKYRKDIELLLSEKKELQK